MRIALITAVSIFALMTGTAQAQSDSPPVPPGCKRIEKPQVADKGYQLLSVGRPATGVNQGDIITMEVTGIDGLNRLDAEAGQIGWIDLCTKAGKPVTLYWVRVSEIKDGKEIVKIPVPDSSKSLEFDSCSATAEKCFGTKAPVTDFKQPVDLEFKSVKRVPRKA